jgi:diacylglycerol kinase (ATP)
MTTRARLILNPSSGREDAPERLELLNERLRERYDIVEVAVTAGDGDAERAARVAIGDGCDTIVTAGGDGTLNEVLNGIAAERAFHAVTLGIVPLGTGNDFAAALGIPTEPAEALDVLLRGHTIDVDVGDVNGRVFVNTSGGGFIAEVSVAVTPQLKTIAGRLAYLVGGAQALFEFDPVHATIAIEPGDQRFDLDIYAFAVCNSRLIGGGRLIAPEAVIDDGLLDVCLIEAMSALEFVALARKVAAGDHIADPRVHYMQASAVRMAFGREIKINTDGEVLGAAACQYRVLPRAARFLAGDAPFASVTRQREADRNPAGPEV